MLGGMRIDPTRDALVVVDLQVDFLPGGALAVPRGDEVLEPLARLALAFPTVVATQDFHPVGHVSFASAHPPNAPYTAIELPSGRQDLWPDHCLRGSRGASLHPALPDRALTLVLRKGTRVDVDSYSAFRENAGPDGRRASTGLAAFLAARGIARVFLAGLARDYCVRWSALDAAAVGLATLVLDDLTRAVFPEKRAETDAAFQDAGVALVLSSELVLV
jgi:nicotinamidase/pyrazinamidase